jgi:hypothetical protein
MCPLSDEHDHRGLKQVEPAYEMHFFYTILRNLLRGSAIRDGTATDEITVGDLVQFQTAFSKREVNAVNGQCRDEACEDRSEKSEVLRCRIILEFS